MQSNRHQRLQHCFTCSLFLPCATPSSLERQSWAASTFDAVSPLPHSPFVSDCCVSLSTKLGVIGVNGVPSPDDICESSLLKMVAFFIADFNFFMEADGMGDILFSSGVPSTSCIYLANGDPPRLRANTCQASSRVNRQSPLLAQKHPTPQITVGPTPKRPTLVKLTFLSPDPKLLRPVSKGSHLWPSASQAAARPRPPPHHPGASQRPKPPSQIQLLPFATVRLLAYEEEAQRGGAKRPPGGFQAGMRPIACAAAPTQPGDPSCLREAQPRGIAQAADQLQSQDELQGETHTTTLVSAYRNQAVPPPHKTRGGGWQGSRSRELAGNFLRMHRAGREVARSPVSQDRDRLGGRGADTAKMAFRTGLKERIPTHCRIGACANRRLPEAARLSTCCEYSGFGGSVFVSLM